MIDSAPAAPASQPGQDALTRLDRVVEQLRLLERGAGGPIARGGQLSEAIRAWERQARRARVRRPTTR